MNIRLLFFLPAIATALLCCTDRGGGNATPKRYAYPRTEVYDSIRADYEAGAVRLSINQGARVSHPDNKDGWLDAAYDRYGATLHLSATHPDGGAMDEALANRRERISLNLGGATARRDVFENGAGMSCEVVVSRDPSTTPVQFIAYGHGVLVSGVFVIAGKTEPADSLRPICDELENEAFAIVNSIRGKDKSDRPRRVKP